MTLTVDDIVRFRGKGLSDLTFDEAMAALRQSLVQNLRHTQPDHAYFQQFGGIAKTPEPHGSYFDLKLYPSAAATPEPKRTQS